MKTKYLSATRWSVTLVIIITIAFAFATPTLANSGPHGNYTPLTDACAGCHRAHTAGAANLLLDSVPALCLTCHGSTGQGAETNVEDGEYLTGGEPLLGGGFVNYKITGTVVASTTSSHSIDGSYQNAWGSGRPWDNPFFNNFDCAGCHTNAEFRDPAIPLWVISTTEVFSYQGQNIAMPLTCTSCHDPHGSPTYRLLQQRIHPGYDWPGFGVGRVVTPTSNETLGQTPDQPGYVPVYTTTNYRDSLGTWCTGCHFLYHEKQSQKLFNALDGRGRAIRYRHTMNITLTMQPPTFPTTIVLTTTLPLEDTEGDGLDGDDDQLFCLTCHFAHGTPVNITGYALNVGPTNDSALLRVDNRGVCQDCHKKE